MVSEDGKFRSIVVPPPVPPSDVVSRSRGRAYKKNRITRPVRRMIANIEMRLSPVPVVPEEVERIVSFAIRRG